MCSDSKVREVSGIHSQDICLLIEVWRCPNNQLCHGQQTVRKRHRLTGNRNVFWILSSTHSSHLVPANKTYYVNPLSAQAPDCPVCSFISDIRCVAKCTPSTTKRGKWCCSLAARRAWLQRHPNTNTHGACSRVAGNTNSRKGNGNENLHLGRKDTFVQTAFKWYAIVNNAKQHKTFLIATLIIKFCVLFQML